MMNKREPLLRVEQFSKSFGGVQALSHVSFDVQEGDVFGIIGPNGSGKTTLVNCITSFVKRDSGSLYFKNQELKRGIPRLQKPCHSPVISKGKADRGLERWRKTWRQGYGGPGHPGGNRL
jgi:ABC-type branched-subunit amino acid transport system ATPase component